MRHLRFILVVNGSLARPMTDWSRVPTFGNRADSPMVRPSAYAIINDRSQRLAVVHTPLGLFLPGGGSEALETPEETVSRETREECGLTILVGAWRGRAVEHVFAAAEDTQFEKRSTFCDATIVDRLVESSEANHTLEWISAADAAELLTPASHRWAVTAWLASAERQHEDS